MSFLITFAAALIGALCVLNLLLTVGVIRRLKQHTELISAMSGPPGPTVLPPGEQAETFTAETEDGDTVSRDELGTDTLVGVFSPGCGACTEQMPDFTERARTFAGGRAHVLAVVSGAREEYVEQIRELSVVARVVVEGHDGPVCTALHVQGFPAFARLASEGRVLTSGHKAADLEVPSGV